MDRQPHEIMDKRTVREKFARGDWLHYGDGTKVYV